MFKYGKKKPQGATRHVPTKTTNGAEESSSSKSVLPSWLLVGFGTALGLFVAFMLYMWQPWQPSVTKVTPEETPPKPAAAKDGPRFEFYDLLPNQKVNTPTEVTEPSAATAPTTPAKTNTEAQKLDEPKATTLEANKTQKDNDAKKQKEKLAKEKAKAEQEKLAKIKADKDKATAKAELAKAAADKVKYTLQAGSFKTSKQADQRRAAISMSGLPVKVVKVTVKPGEDWYRVVVGPFNGKDKTSEARQTLSGDGIDSLMVKQDKK